MARARSIKPGFFKNEILAELPALTRLLFIGLWCIADREGRFEDRPKKIKMELFAADDIDVAASLSELENSGFLLRYEINGARYVQIKNFTKHQMPHHKEVASEIPAPEGYQQITKQTYNVPSEVRDEVFARDGGKCLRCGAKEALSIDHIVPLSKGGDNSISNLQTLCKACNSSKGGATKDYRSFNVGPTLNQRKPNDGASCPSESLTPESLIPESIDTPLPPLQGVIEACEQDQSTCEPQQPAKPKREASTTLSAYLQDCSRQGCKAVPDDHYIRRWAATAGIDDEMLQVAWYAFRDDHISGGRRAKKYKDWPAAFANSVKAGWYRLWYIPPNGPAEWTSQGRAAQRNYGEVAA